MNDVLVVLSDAEREHMQRIYARARVAESGNPDMSADEAQDALIQEQRQVNKLRREHGIEPDVDIEIRIETGLIMEAQ